MGRLLLVLIILGIIFYTVNTVHVTNPQQLSFTPSGSPVPSISGSAVLSDRTKTSDCHVNGALQDSACTPGAVFPNATKEQICTPGYSKSVRNVPVSEKRQVYEEYGLHYPQKPGSYEADHLISLELGGSNDIANLWPEAAEPRPGFHEKDIVENYLHDQMCKGAISLQEAQKEISTDWLAVYRQLPSSYMNLNSQGE